MQSYGSEGLQLVEHEETVLSGQTVLQLTFDPGVFGHTPVTARCRLDHPFYIKNKGRTEAEEKTPLSGSVPSNACLPSVRVVLVLPQLDRGALWDPVL